MLKRTPLYQQHVQAGAQIVDFFGWEMPLHYGSQLLEHRHVRSSVGMFDVSHMCIIDILGGDAVYFLRFLLSNDIQKLVEPGRALYTCMLNHRGGIIDDMIVYRLNQNDYRLVVNAGSGQKVLQWLHLHTDRYDVLILERDELAILAVQGPDALHYVTEALSTDDAKAISKARLFSFIELDDLLIARTGYTGEDGVEIITSDAKVRALWKSLLKEGVKPCGLGSRDTLRLEAGLNLYGADMCEDTSPLETNLAWTVSWDDRARDFIGKQALQAQLERGVEYQLVGLLMTDAGVLRDHQKVYFENDQEGEITSGGFSPTLGHAIALARIPMGDMQQAMVERRGKRIPVSIVKPPFVRRGQKIY